LLSFEIAKIKGAKNIIKFKCSKIWEHYSHRRNYIEARGGTCLLLISWSCQLETWNNLALSMKLNPSADSFRQGLQRYTFNRPKSMTLRQYCMRLSPDI